MAKSKKRGQNKQAKSLAKTNRSTISVAKSPRISAPRSRANGAAEATSGNPAESKSRLIPTAGELKSLYERYTHGSRFDEHDKAFYFVLDVGGISRAKQLIAHVEEVLAELEEFAK